jgi:hypothetical protein
MARLRNLSQSTAFLTKEMSKNTVYAARLHVQLPRTHLTHRPHVTSRRCPRSFTTTAAGASSASLAMAILVMLAIGIVRIGQVGL